MGRVHKAPRVIGDLGTKKGKVTLPGLHEPPVLTDTGRRLANMYSTPRRCADGKTKKTALFAVWGTAKATVTPRVIWGISGCLKRGEVSRVEDLCEVQGGLVSFRNRCYGIINI